VGKRKSRLRQRREQKQSRRSATAPVEARSAEAVTVGWMLTTLATVAAQIVGGITLVVAAMADDPQRAPLLLRVAPGLMMFISVVTGLVGLALVPVVLRLRLTPPPRPIIVGVILINLSPLVIVAILCLAQG
jgi:hypothetical protein